MTETTTPSVEGRLEQAARAFAYALAAQDGGTEEQCSIYADKHTAAFLDPMRDALRQIDALPCKGGEADQALRRWVIIQEPGRVPDRKGAFLTRDQVKDFLVEAIDARPTATLTIVSQDCYGDPIFSDAGEWLLMTDARYRAVYQRYIDRNKAATPTTEPDTGRGLREAATNLLEACEAADAAEDLGDLVPGDLMFALRQALAALSDTPRGREISEVETPAVVEPSASPSSKGGA